MYLTLFIFFLLYSFSSNKYENLFKSIEFHKAIDIVLKYGKVDDKLRIKCVKDKDKFYHLTYETVEFSGKRYGDLGDQASCKRFNLTYFFFIHDISESIRETIKKQQNKQNVSDKRKIKAFINTTKYVIGLCHFFDCLEASENLLRENLRKIDYFLDTNVGEIKLFFDNDFYKLHPKFSFYNSSIIIPVKKKRYENEYSVIRWNIYIFLAFSLLCTLIKVFFFFADNNETLKNNMKSNLSDSDEEDEEIEEEENIKDINRSSIFYDGKINIFNSNEKNEFDKFLSILDIFNNIRNFFLFKNNYFDGSSIEVIGFIRMIIMIGIIFGNNFLIGIKTFIQIDIFNFQIFKSLKFIFVKLTFFNNIIWIILDGTIFGFKILSYYKNYIEKGHLLTSNIDIFFILKFLIYLFPNVLIFLFTYFYFYIFATNFEDNIYYDYYTTTLNDFQCYKQPSIIFNPFNFYKKDFECFSFVYIFINEFYCILIILIIIYILSKTKSHMFSFIISFVILIQLFTVQLSVSSKMVKDTPIVFDMFLGENHMEKQLHLFLSVFYLGFLIGTIFFHYHNPLSSISFSSFKEYFPFSFLKKIIEFINNIEIIYNIIICCFFTFLLLFIAFIPHFFNKDFGLINDEKKKIIQYIIFYEKSVYALFFSIFLIFFKILSEKTFISSAFQNEFIISFEKIRVIFFCSIEFLMNYCYTFFIFNYIFTYKNIVYITFGLFLFIYIANFLIYVLFIMPMIKFVKAIQSNNKNNLIGINYSIVSKKAELTSYKNVFNE